MGLAISRMLARMMDGDVTVASEPGKGSVFTCACRVAFLKTQRWHRSRRNKAGGRSRTPESDNGTFWNVGGAS